MFDNELLRTFVGVAEGGGFTRAAERLSLTQSAVSAQIKRLELQAGCALLSRNTRSVALTVQGEILLDYARSIFALHEGARQRLGAVRQTGSRIRIGVSEGLFDRGPAAVLQVFKAEHAAVELTLQIGITVELCAALQGGHLDLVLGITCGAPLDGETLWSDQLVWAFSRTAALDRTQPVPIAFFPEPCPYRGAAVTALSTCEVRWRLACVSPSAASLRAAAIFGLGVAPMLRGQLEQDLDDAGPALGLPPLPTAHFAAWTTGRSLAVQRVLQLIRGSEHLRRPAMPPLAGS
jgi:DNA-binding transcriptional LysR family regulator